MKVFLTDIDGVVLNWGSALEWYLASEHNIKPKNRLENFDDAIDWLEMDKTEFSFYLEKFHRSEYFKHVPVFSDAEKVMFKMKDEGWNFIAITAAGKSNKIYENRIFNLNKVLPNVFKGMLSINPRDSKLESLQQFKETYWVDDSVKHVVSGNEAGHKSFLMSRNDYFKSSEYDLNQIDVVKDWFELYKNISN